MDRKDAVILDVDGTLCDTRGGWLRPFPAHERVVTAAREAHAAGLELLVVTAREEWQRERTAAWLARNLPVPHAGLYMKRTGDYRADHVVKREILEGIRADGFHVVHAYDDKQSVIDMWRSEGIETSHVQPSGSMIPGPPMVRGTGWRFWFHARYMRPGRLNAPIRGGLWAEGWNASQCKDGHRLPSPNCSCGIHLCRTWEDVNEYVMVKGFAPIIVIGELEYAGHVLPTATPRIDPSGTVRVERARLTRLDLSYMPPDEQKRAAPLLSKFYGVPVGDFGGKAASPTRPAVTAPSPLPVEGWITCTQGDRHWGRNGAAGLLIHRNGADGPEVLLQLRSKGVDNGGTWGTPGGALHRGESAVDGALREAGEELGLRPGDVQVGNESVDDHGGWSYTTVLATPRGPLTLRHNRESVGTNWFALDALGSLRLHPGLEAALPALRSRLVAQDGLSPAV